MSITRRRLIATGATALAAGIAGVWYLRRGARAASAPMRPAMGPPPADRDGACVLYAVGDAGYPNAIRANVVTALLQHARVRPPNVCLFLGDNFYEHGIGSVDDARWQEEIELPFASLDPAVPLYAILGNHDYQGSIQAQIDYTARGSRWRMPAANWTLERPLRDGSTVELFALDTTPIRLGFGHGDDQLQWLEERLMRSRARWKLVLGHHPILSYGAHGPCDGLGATLDPLFERCGVHAYLSGHEHDLQLVRSAAGWVQIISGAGSAPRTTGRGPATEFASDDPGFACLIADVDGLWIEFIGATPAVEARAPLDVVCGVRRA
ncbi:MAG: metallophosphoesterase [Planctomycetes bacterium]|nr:metallophosphoesterase [Planctomycetota bacterium]